MTPFEALGLPDTATVEDVKKAFRRLSLKTHPDHGGSSEAFRCLTQARHEALLAISQRNGIKVAFWGFQIIVP